MYVKSTNKVEARLRLTKGILFLNARVNVEDTLTFFQDKKEAKKLNGQKAVPYIIIIVLLIALGFTSTAAFAYWQDVQQIGNVVIRFDGEDAELKADLTSDEFTGQLVPEGYVFFEGEVSEVEFEYDVYLTRDLVQSMNLVIEAIEVKIDDEETYAHLIDINIQNQGDLFVGELFNSTVKITVVVRLIEPIDEAEATERGLDPSLINVDDSRQAYDDIKGKTISFSLSFRVEPRNNE
ncbi:MAG: hypothetical protein CVV61_02710 [Tenericutes bacterium HGW-Tenericutes-6]|jgi:hypothetical protein|nr:MAG: hypothetical protein CVV61_02710 [Tenericutes bacterium HGW-Tenericutes-6]